MFSPILTPFWTLRGEAGRALLCLLLPVYGHRPVLVDGKGPRLGVDKELARPALQDRQLLPLAHVERRTCVVLPDEGLQVLWLGVLAVRRWVRSLYSARAVSAPAIVFVVLGSHTLHHFWLGGNLGEVLGHEAESLASRL